MSAARLAGLALITAALSLPAMAQEDVELRGRLEYDFSKGSEEAANPAEVLPMVVVTDTGRRQLLVSKPAILRYAGVPAAPSKIAAERRGLDPDRVAKPAEPENR